MKMPHLSARSMPRASAFAEMIQEAKERPMEANAALKAWSLVRPASCSFFTSMVAPVSRG